MVVGESGLLLLLALLTLNLVLDGVGGTTTLAGTVVVVGADTGTVMELVIGGGAYMGTGACAGIDIDADKFVGAVEVFLLVGNIISLAPYVEFWESLAEVLLIYWLIDD